MTSRYANLSVSLLDDHLQQHEAPTSLIPAASRHISTALLAIAWYSAAGVISNDARRRTVADPLQHVLTRGCPESHSSHSPNAVIRQAG